MKKFILWALMTFLFMTGLALLSLNMLSGTGDSQRKGLEQVLSDTFRGTATIGKLTNFNIVPQFLIGLENLDITGMPDGGSVSIERAHIAFGFLDLMRKSRRIEAFSIENAKLKGNYFYNQEIKISKAEIVPAQTGSAGILIIKGYIGTKELEADVNLDYTSGTRATYSLAATSPVHLTLGKVAMSGELGSLQDNGRDFLNLHLEGYGESCNQANGERLAAGLFFSKLLPRISLVESPENLHDACVLLSKLANPNQ